MNDNWYIVLELEFYPSPVEDQVLISKRIEEKRAFWTARSNHPDDGPQYDSWRENIDQIKRDMANAEKRSELAKNALNSVDGQLDTITDRGNRPVKNKQIKYIAKQVKCDERIVEKRARDRNIEFSEGISSQKKDYKVIYNKHTNKPDEYASFNANLPPLLRVISKKNLYDFLAPEEDPRSLTTKHLLSEAEEIRKKNSKGKQSAIKTAKRDLAAAARTSAFKDDSTRWAYDAYLDYLAKMDIINSAVDQISSLYDGRSGRDQSKQFIESFLQITKNVEDATELYIAMCEVNGFSYDVGEDESAAFKNKLACKCGYINDIASGRLKCASCGDNLWNLCPKCTTKQLSTINFCDCGFDFSNIDKADRLCDLAREALNMYDLGEAKSLLQQARTLYSQHSKIKPLDDDLRKIDRQIGSSVSEVDNAILERRFYHARELFFELQRNFSFYRDERKLSKINAQIASAERLFAFAQKQSSAIDILEACKEAYSVCADIDGLQELVSKHSDLPVEALSISHAAAKNVTASVVNGKVSIGLTLPDEGETAIVVLFRFDRYPTSEKDPNAQRKEFSLADFERGGCLFLEEAQNRNYYIAVYLEFSTDGQKLYTSGTQCYLNLGEKVVLFYSFSKKPLSKRILFKVSPNKPISRLPKIELVYNVGNIPVYLASSKHLMTIPEQELSGDFCCELDHPTSLKNTFVKPFLSEKSDVFQLKLATNSTNRIS